MDLKFTFNSGPKPSDHAHGAEPGGAHGGGHGHADHSHGAPAAGIPLPFSTKPSAPASSSGVLELHARRGDGVLIAEAISGDGVVYASSEVACAASDGTADAADASADAASAASAPSAPVLAKALRSALSRAVAGLEGPLVEAVTAVTLSLGGQEAEVLAELGISADVALDPPASVGEALQRRIGVTAGTPIRFAQ
ncbi:MAG: hypothetical protein ACK5LO_02080 [Leucobacter sp.]